MGSVATFSRNLVTLPFAVYFHQLLSYYFTKVYLSSMITFSFSDIYFSSFHRFKRPTLFFKTNAIEAWFHFGLGKSCHFPNKLLLLTSLRLFIFLMLFSAIQRNAISLPLLHRFGKLPHESGCDPPARQPTQHLSKIFISKGKCNFF